MRCWRPSQWCCQPRHWCWCSHGYGSACTTSPWRSAFEHGLAPIAVGLIAASGIIVARGADHTVAQYVLTALATVVFCTTKVQPLVVVGLAGLAGWLGLV